MPDRTPRSLYCAGLVLIGGLGTGLQAEERTWFYDQTRRGLNEHSLRLEVQMPLEDPEFEGDLEFDSAMTVELGWRYEGLIDEVTPFGLVLGAGIAYSLHSLDDYGWEADFEGISTRFRVGAFYQVADPLRIEFSTMIGGGTAALDAVRQPGSGIIGIAGEAEDFLFESGFRLAAHTLVNRIGLSAGIDYLYRGGDYWFADQEIEFTIDQNFIQAWAGFSWEF